MNRLTALLILLAASLAVPNHAEAGPMVTYTWVAGSHLGNTPTSAKFDAPLSSVLSGKLTPFDITNIQFSFPGIDPLSFTAVSTLGFDFAAFVDPVSGLPIFKDSQQGLAVIAYRNFLFSDTFLSILFDNPSNGAVSDTYNAINGGPGSLGFGSGHWTVQLPATSVPEPATLALLGIALAGLRFSRRRGEPVIGTARRGGRPSRT
jgi:hypothetical protein